MSAEKIGLRKKYDWDAKYCLMSYSRQNLFNYAPVFHKKQIILADMATMVAKGKCIKSSGCNSEHYPRRRKLMFTQKLYVHIYLQSRKSI